ncbi:MAG: endonuclease/exonuclease/phosphatase family protein [Clostridia bacterium]|nr:endonuclease/exonuclease/phosphatase family protein [Clostridia bacterium]
MKTVLKIIMWVVIAAVVIVGGYFAYVLIDYHRIEDNVPLEITGGAGKTAEAATEYTIVSYNVGFGAYSDDYSFFMDGGKYSRAFSEDAVNENLGGAVETMLAQEPDFLLVQEVDKSATRSYHVDEEVPIVSAFPEYASVFALNYDSPYLFYPITSPHGKSVAGLYTLSFADVSRATRRSLPIESGLMKLVDLDRCYSISEIPVANGKTLYLINLHLSAYSSDGSIATEQLQMLFEEIEGFYAEGNYVICGGDFNKDLLGDSSSIFGVSGEDYTWAQSFPFDLVPDGFSLVAPFDEEDPVPSCRNANEPYNPETTFVLTIDGFIVSDNVTVTDSAVVDTGFKYSDHNPVKMTFSLTA